MVEKKTIQKKFDMLFKDRNSGLVHYNEDTKFVLDPNHCYGMALDEIEPSGLLPDRDNIFQTHAKIPHFEGDKAISFFKLEWLERSVQLLRMMGYETIGIKMSKQNEWPIELIAITENHESLALVPHERIWIAPKIPLADETKEWVKKETKDEPKDSKKVVKKNVK
jgi:hypothetical protein